MSDSIKIEWLKHCHTVDDLCKRSENFMIENDILPRAYRIDGKWFVLEWVILYDDDDMIKETDDMVYLWRLKGQKVKPVPRRKRIDMTKYVDEYKTRKLELDHVDRKKEKHFRATRMWDMFRDAH